MSAACGTYVVRRDEEEREVLAFLRQKVARVRAACVSLVTMPAPDAPLQALWGDDHGPAVLWAHLGGRELAGVGEALTVTAAGAGRFAQVDDAAQALNGCHLVRCPGAAPVVPTLLGGFAFAPHGSPAGWRAFGGARFVLPRWTYERHGEGRATLTLALGPGEQVEPGAWTAEAAGILRRLHRPPHIAPLPPVRVTSMPAHRWRGMVEEVLAAIAAGELRKVVLARAFQVAAAEPVSVAALLARLAAHGNGGYRFAFRFGGSTFLGSSPELLVARRGRQVESEALAGSVGDPDGEREREAALLDDPKQRAEHAIVVEAIRACLARVCDRLEVPPTPVVRHHGDVAHLHTPMRGRLAGDTSVTSLASLLHPTPAVGGVPVAAACAHIARQEPVPRGWYAGAVGVVEAGGDGVLAVALRGALVRGRRARVWSGAGIVAGSTPAGEYAETEMKARSVLAALGLEG